LFGYLYARRGLEAAMIAHFSGDVIIHFVGPMFFH
jgi:membrane protease YdiL (CAAX protease family)